MYDIESIRKKINSDDTFEMYDALIDIGKNELYEFESVVRRFLKHTDSEVRRAAIMVLSTYWERKYIITELENIWKNDIDELVRVTALISWIAYFQNTKDKEITLKLHSLIVDEIVELEIKKEAIKGIYIVNNRKVPEKEIGKLDFVFDEIEFNKHIDWEEINQIISSV
ncbi:HEAT repeat domain-containing protein [Spirochaeta cellobiosiphila]|uniref:HEAT repeat domain-containing protein n=1 Tax=Spirochaeta cellobiosiphila TaxID=504483 RepID=UPI0003F839D8|nr:HEAT repeat domain-containing protein [Spirochaeta cellobiosiphila]